jgi:preprotein translocase subunit SecE
MSEQQAKLPLPQAKRGLSSFFADVKRELKKVSWPTRTETNRLFGVVLAVCVILTAVMAGLGFIFENFVNLITKTGSK